MMDKGTREGTIMCIGIFSFEGVAATQTTTKYVIMLRRMRDVARDGVRFVLPRAPVDLTGV